MSTEQRPAIRRLRLINDSPHGNPHATKVYDGETELTHVLRVRLDVDRDAFVLEVDTFAGFEIEGPAKTRRIVWIGPEAREELGLDDLWAMIEEYGFYRERFGLWRGEIRQDPKKDYDLDRGEVLIKESRHALRAALGFPVDGTPGPTPTP